MLNDFADKYANATAAQRCLIDMVLAVNPDDMTPFQKQQLVLMVAAYAMVDVSKLQFSGIMRNYVATAQSFSWQIAERLPVFWQSLKSGHCCGLEQSS